MRLPTPRMPNPPRPPPRALSRSPRRPKASASYSSATAWPSAMSTTAASRPSCTCVSRNRDLFFRNMGHARRHARLPSPSRARLAVGLPRCREIPPRAQCPQRQGLLPHARPVAHHLKADTIVAFFGYNESFDGPTKVANFEAELDAWVKHTLGKAYNGKAAPRLVLVSPIAFEDLTGKRDLPKGDEGKRQSHPLRRRHRDGRQEADQPHLHRPLLPDARRYARDRQALHHRRLRPDRRRLPPARRASSRTASTASRRPCPRPIPTLSTMP
jgi:hypothetical protein